MIMDEPMLKSRSDGGDEGAYSITILDAQEQSLFAGLDAESARRFFAYLFAQPSKPGQRPQLRSLAIGLYDPWCDRRSYPLGILWQSAPYSFCSHMCRYCYGRSYLRGKFKDGGRVKDGFRRKFDACLRRMNDLGLPPRHLSMANSTDILQAHLEREHRHVLFMLERLAGCRDMFSSFGILTKNPGVLLDDERYAALLRELGVEVQVSIAFFRDDAARHVEPGAPAVSDRMRAIEKLVTKGVRVAIRVDPLFPRNVPACPVLQGRDEDLIPLVRWAKQAGAAYIIGKPLKLPVMGAVDRELHRQLAPAFADKRGSYWRMPAEEQERLLRDMRDICAAEGLPFEHCFLNILKRNSQRHAAVAMG